MRKICFLTTLIPTQMYSHVNEKSTNNMADAANALQWNIYDGLCRNYKQGIKLINILPIGSFPQYYTEPFIARELFDTQYEKGNVNVGFCNIKLVRNYFQPRQIFKELLSEFKGVDDGILYVYTISAPIITAVDLLKRKNKRIKVCSIIADLPNMSSLSSQKSIFQEYFEKYLSKKSYRKTSCIDAYVLLTKYMADYMGIRKPYCVVEGISNCEERIQKELVFDEEYKTVVYTGTLHKRFGVLNLISAFSTIKDDSYRLIICGMGDSEEEVKAAAKIDKRIEYLGQLPRTDVIKIQDEATVLVNPRQNNEEFTKYSFPSKIMEYLSAGKPVVCYKLDGIPNDYDDYLFYVKDNSIQSLADKLLEICEKSEEERKLIGIEGQTYVFTKKNEVIQTKKIKDMMDKI